MTLDEFEERIYDDLDDEFYEMCKHLAELARTAKEVNREILSTDLWKVIEIIKPLDRAVLEVFGDDA